MKIQVVSDLHFEFGCIDSNYEKMIETPADVLVLAGDIAASNTIIPLLQDIAEDAPDKEVLFVPGNHEYYGTKRVKLDKELMEISNGNLHILLERDICMSGHVFIGTTGWWDGSGGTLGETVRHGLNDFRMIHDIHENGGDGIWWGQKARTFIDSRLYFYRANFPNMKRVVVTHHFPHRRSIAPQFRGSCLNVCFYNAWEDIIKEYRPELWIHGHTHCDFDYLVKDNDGHPHVDIVDNRVTRIVCNPQGYPEEFAVPKEKILAHYNKENLTLTDESYAIYKTTENQNFDPCKVVEI